MARLWSFLTLMRLANVVTAVADVLAGIAISGYFSSDGDYYPVLLLCISTIGLYSGGIIFNDVFDAGLDAIERPERPIPSGMVSVEAAAAYGILFFSIGVGAAALFQPLSFQIALLIVLACLSYNRWAKHYTVWGPLNMGLCRGLNLMLGVSILAPAITDWWFLGLIPLIYIASITIVSRGEVHGGNKKMLSIAAVLYAVVIVSILWVSASMQNLWLTLLFLVPLVLMIFRPLLKAFKLPNAENIGKAVKAGVIALILLNASWAGAFGIWQVALIIVILLPLSLWLSKMFAVT
jgi:1,4-dihydroxy-2-naphthoate octaprenyltransferase